MGLGSPVFARVTMSLAQVLQGDFFTEYIKIGMWDPVMRLLDGRIEMLTMDAGDIIMLSRGRRDVNNVFTLKDGALLHVVLIQMVTDNPQENSPCSSTKQPTKEPGW